MNPALTAVVTGAVAGGDAVNYSLATTAVTLSGVGEYPITVTLGTQPELRRDDDRRTLTMNKGGGHGGRRREEQVLRHGEPGADGGGDGRVAGGDAVNYTLATTAVTVSGVGPIRSR